MCLYPRLIDNPKYKINKKNGGEIPHMKDQRIKLVPIGCGKCLECTRQKTRSWQIRLLEEVKGNKLPAYFITFTFSNEEYRKLNNEIKGVYGYDRDNEIAVLAIRRFLENWRSKHKKSVRHWLVTELGGNGTENIHIHGIIWTDKGADEIKKFWKYGFSDTGKYVSEKTVNYIVKYIGKTDEKHKEYKPKICTSAGIGKAYTEKIGAKKHQYIKGKTREEYVNQQGHKMNLPIYYKNKLYTEDERERLWIEKLDKKIRYVDGIAYDISKTEEHYYKALKLAQLKNKQLGYGSDENTWERKKYENERRNLLTLKRITKKLQADLNDNDKKLLEKESQNREKILNEHIKNFDKNKVF